MVTNYESKSCYKCQKAVRSTEKVLVCGLWCRKSFHNDCAGLSNSETRVVVCSNERIKFHCETCENRLGIELSGDKKNCLLELVQRLLKVTSELSNDNSVINTKLDTVLRSNARLEEYILQSPKCFEKASEENSDNSVEYLESFFAKQIIEISEENDTNCVNPTVNSKQMCYASKHQQTDNSNSSLHIASDFPKQLSNSQQPNGAEECSSNALQEWELPGLYNNIQDPLSLNKQCPQELEVRDDHSGMQDLQSSNKEEFSSSEDFLVESVFSIEETEYEGGEVMAESEVNKEELKHEVESTISDNEPESTISVLVEERIKGDSGDFGINVSTATGRGRRIQSTTRQEASYGKKIDSVLLKHRCRVCKIMFAQVHQLVKHKRVARCELRHSCSICHKTFTTSSSLKRHFRLHTGERPYVCSFCNRSFVQSTHLIHHTRLHTGERPYSCRICSKTFISNAQLKDHLRLHTGQRPFICGICNKTFSHRTQLKYHHSKIHTSERRYTCGVCNKTYATSKTLKKHSRVHTGEHSYVCKVCHKLFQRYSHLRKHLQVHTGEI